MLIYFTPINTIKEGIRQTLLLAEFYHLISYIPLIFLQLKYNTILYSVKVSLTTMLTAPVVTFCFAAIEAHEGNSHFLNFMILIAYYGLIYTLPPFALFLILLWLFTNRPFPVYKVKGILSIVTLVLIFSVPNPMHLAEDFVLVSIYALVTLTCIWIYKLNGIGTINVKNFDRQ